MGKKDAYSHKTMRGHKGAESASHITTRNEVVDRTEVTRNDRSHANYEKKPWGYTEDDMPRRMCGRSIVRDGNMTAFGEMICRRCSMPRSGGCMRGM